MFLLIELLYLYFRDVLYVRLLIRCFFFFFVYRFTLIKEHLIEFNQLAMANSSGSDDMLNRVMPRDNIGLAALLKTNETAWENCKCLFYRRLYIIILTIRFRNKGNFLA